MKSSQSTYTIRETITTQGVTSSRSLSTQKASQEPLMLPPITWEQFLLVNVEIDRLTTLCSMLTQKNKSLQMRYEQNSDLSAQNECLRKEILILRENDMIPDLKSMNVELSKETRRLSSELNEKIEEVEEWKFRYANLEKSLSKQESLTSKNISKTIDLNVIKEQLVREKSSETQMSKLKAQIQILTDEKEQLSNLLMKKEDMELELRRELRDLKLSGKRVEFTEKVKESSKDKVISELDVNISKLQEAVLEIKELKSAVHLASVENENLVKALEEKTLEIESLKSKVPNPFKVNNELNVSLKEKNRLQVLLSEKAKECEILKLKVIEFENLSSNLHEFREKLNIISVENEKLNKVIIEKQNVIEALNVKLNAVQHSESEIVQVKDVNVSVVEIHKEMHDKLEKELKVKTEQISQLEEKIALLLVQNRQLVQEKEIMNANFSDEIRELEILRGKLSEINILASQVQIYEEEKKERMKLNEKVKREFKLALLEKEKLIKELRAQIVNFEQKLASSNEYREKMLHYTSENEKLRVVLAERAKVIEVLKLEISELVFANNNLKTALEEKKYLDVEIKEKVKEINVLKLKIGHLEKGSLLARELNEKLSVNNAKSERLIMALNEKLDEAEQLKMKSSLQYDIQMQLNLATQEKEEYINLYNLQGQALEKYQEKIIKLESEIFELKKQQDVSVKSSSVESELNIAVQESQKVGIIVEAERVESLKVDVQQLELNNLITDLKLKLELSSQENEKLTILISEKEQEIHELKLKLSESIKSEEMRMKETEELNLKAKEIETLNVELSKFVIEKQRLEEIIGEKIRENERLSQKTIMNVQFEEKLNVFVREKESLEQIISEKEKIIEELKLRSLEQNNANILYLRNEMSVLTSENKKLSEKLVEKQKEVDSFKASIPDFSEFEKEFQAVLDERDQLRLTVTEKQKDIKTLESKVVSVERELLSASGLKSKVTLLDSESKWLNHLVIERLTKLNTAEQELETSTSERKRLSLEIAERMAEIGLLKAKMNELQEQANTIPDLKGKISLLAFENERMDKLLIEKTKTLEERQSKYATLENLYLHVRGHMKKPEIIDKKYQEIVRAIEKVEFTLGLYGRAKAFKKTVSVYSILQPDNSQSPTNLASDAMSKVFPATVKSSRSEKIIIERKGF